jgi:hypothetical protein
MMGVGNGVKVAVGGNHTIVGVMVAITVGILVGSRGVGVEVGVVVHAFKKLTKVQNNKNFFIKVIKLISTV